MLKKWTMILAVILALTVQAVCVAEGMPTPEATPTAEARPVPTATPKWFTPIKTQLYFGRADYEGEADEENTMITHLLGMEYITTHMAELCVTNSEVCHVEYEIKYSAAKNLQFEVHEKITAPDGSIMEETSIQEPYAAGPDEHCFLDGELMNEVFADMYETEGGILPGVYLYEMSVGGEMMATTTLTVLESDFSPGRTDYKTALYEDETCTTILQTLGEHSSVKILDIVKSQGAYQGYLFKVEKNEKTGYVKCYNVFPVVDRDILSSLAAENAGGVDIKHITSEVQVEGLRHYYDILFMTRGQAQYCVDQKDFKILTSAYITVSRAFLPAQLQTVEAKVTKPNGKKETLTLEFTEDLDTEESFELVRQKLSGSLREGEYQVEFYNGGEQYAQYTASCWGDTPYIYDGKSENWDMLFYSRVIAPDGAAYESGVLQLKSSYSDEDGNTGMTYETAILEETFAQMAKEHGIQCGIYQLEIYMNNQLVSTKEIDVLDDPTVLGLTSQQTGLYQDTRCKTEIASIPGGQPIEYTDGKTSRFETKSSYGDWMETHISAPAKYKGNEGYVDTAYIGMLTDETLPDWLERMHTTRERKNWMSLSLSNASTASTFAFGSATEGVMTRGMAELAAENQAYRFHGILYYSLKEDRAAQFRSRITKPDGTAYEEYNEIVPSYNIEDTSLYWDFTPCNMFRQMKNGEGILPGSYHYEVTELGSGMTMDGWFEVLDLALAMGQTREDAQIYNSSMGSHVIGNVPIYSPIFLYEGWHKMHEGHKTEYNEEYTEYNARVSWNGIMGYMSQRAYEVEMANAQELERLMGEETVPVHSLEIFFWEGEEEEKLNGSLTMDQALMIGDTWGEAGIYAKMGYASAQTEQLMLFTFMVQAPSGKQLAMSDMYVYFDDPGRDESENVLIDGATIETLFARMSDQGKLESGIYRYSVMMNGEILAQTELEVEGLTSGKKDYAQRRMTEEASAGENETEVAQMQAGDVGIVRIRELGNVNVREKSNADSRRLGSAKAGAEYPCVSIAENGWYQIRLNDDVVGYVSNKMASLLE